MTPVLVTMKEVCALTTLSRTHVNNLRHAGNFPAPVALGEKRIAFSRTEVLDWIERRLAARNTEAA